MDVSLLFGVSALVWAASASAQTAPAADGVPRWDVTGVAAAFAARPAPAREERYGDRWYATAQGAFIGGRLLSTHVKLELELAATGEGRLYRVEFVAVPNVPSLVPVSVEDRRRSTQATASVLWQFGDNQWIHPFVQAGVAVDVERARVWTWPQTLYVGDPRLPNSRIDIAGGHAPDVTTTTARAVLGAGAKIYVTERAFIRADTRYAGGAQGQYVLFRAGVGVDF